MFQDPAFWTSIGFAILLAFLIWKRIDRMITSGLDARAERIRATLDEAAKLREEAQHLLAEYQRKQRDTVKETEEIVAHAKTEAARIADKAKADLETAIGRREQMAIDKIAQAEADALRQVREVSVDLAIAAARALIAEKLDEESREKLIDDAISELPDKLH